MIVAVNEKSAVSVSSPGVTQSSAQRADGAFTPEYRAATAVCGQATRATAVACSIEQHGASDRSRGPARHCAQKCSLVGNNLTVYPSLPSNLRYSTIYGTIKVLS